MKSFEIAHLITTIDLGGAERQLLTLAVAQKKQGSSVQIIYLKGNPALRESFLKYGIEVREELVGQNFIRQCFLLRRIVRGQSRVVHAHLPRAELMCAISLPFKSFLVTRHNAEPFFPKSPRLVSRLLSRFVARRAYCVVAISRAVANYLSTSQEISRRTKCQVVYYGLAKSEMKKYLAPEKNSIKWHLGTVARLVPQKNLTLLIDTANELRRRGNVEFSVTVVGVGPLENELRAMTERLDLQKEFNWVGQTENVDSIYDDLDIFILTSNYEGFGLVLLEAFLHNLPVIARGVSAIPEVLGDEHPGLVESAEARKFADRIEDFISNEKLRLECLEIQRRQVAKFRIENTREALEKIYHKVLGESYES